MKLIIRLTTLLVVLVSLVFADDRVRVPAVAGGPMAALEAAGYSAWQLSGLSHASGKALEPCEYSTAGDQEFLFNPATPQDKTKTRELLTQSRSCGTSVVAPAATAVAKPEPVITKAVPPPTKAVENTPATKSSKLDYAAACRAALLSANGAVAEARRDLDAANTRWELNGPQAEIRNLSRKLDQAYVFLGAGASTSFVGGTVVGFLLSLWRARPRRRKVEKKEQNPDEKKLDLIISGVKYRIFDYKDFPQFFEYKNGVLVLPDRELTPEEKEVLEAIHTWERWSEAWDNQIAKKNNVITTFPQAPAQQVVNY